MEDFSEEILDQETSEEISEESSDMETSEETSEDTFDQETSEETSEDTSDQETSVETSEETSEDTSEQIDYTETLIHINDHLYLISNRLDYVGASFWILLSLIIAIVLYRLFAWFWKDL